jgi:hypothetical protein
MPGKKNANKQVAKRSSKATQVKYPSAWTIQREFPMPPSGKFDNVIYNVVDGYTSGSTLTTSTTINSFAAFSFTVSSLADFSSWSGAFDQYRIVAIEVTVLPQPGNTPGQEGHIYSVIDYDDANNLTTLTEATNYPNCVVIQGSKENILVRSFKPHIAVANYSGSFSSFNNMCDQWIDSASTGTQHYGLKFAMSPTTSVCSYDFMVKFHMQYRNPR